MTHSATINTATDHGTADIPAPVTGSIVDNPGATVPAGRPVTIRVNPDRDDWGTATLTPRRTRHGDVVHLVTVDEDATRAYGAAGRDGQVIGGIVRTGGNWGPVAYADREHLFNSEGPVYFLPNARSRAAAVRALLRWWWYVDRRTDAGANPSELNPMDLTAHERRNLLA